MLSKLNHKTIYAMWVIGGLYILPLIAINSPYYDDIGRSVYGYFSWGIDGRPLSDLIFWILDIGGPATNIAPFPQIICILILTSLCYLLHLQFNPQHKLGWLIFTPIFLSPFFVQNIAFQFDSVTMAFSVLFACVPVFMANKGWLKLFLSSAICITLSLCFYQASLSAFIGVICIYVIFELNNETDPLKLLSAVSAAVIGMGVGYTIYAMLVVPTFVTSDYANGYNQRIEGLADLAKNIEMTVTVLRGLLSGLTGVIYLTIFAFSLAGGLCLAFRILKKSNHFFKKIINLVLLALSIIVMLICIPGPGIALKSMPIGPRVFIGFGFFMSGMLAMSSFIWKDKVHRTNFLSIILCIVSFSFIATFSNATKSQDKLTEKIINEISLEIYNVGFEKIKTVTIDGQMLYTPVAQKAIAKYPLLRQLIPVYFNGSLAWGVVKMTEYYIGYPQPPLDRQNEIIANICNMKELSNGGLYKTYFKDGDLVISFSFRKCH